MILAAQTKAEAEWLVQKMREYDFCGSILEIGSHAGGFLSYLAYHCKPGSKIRSVDLSRDYGLEDAIIKLNQHGYDAAACVSDSKHPQAISWARNHGPYDFVFIDGDHTYEGVDADFKNYGPLGRWVGFHDIKELGPNMGTVEHWEQIKTQYPSMEFAVNPEWNGIGLIKMPINYEVNHNISEIQFGA